MLHFSLAKQRSASFCQIIFIHLTFLNNSLETLCGRRFQRIDLPNFSYLFHTCIFTTIKSEKYSDICIIKADVAIRKQPKRLNSEPINRGQTLGADVERTPHKLKIALQAKTKW